jgi:hypothetical protein
MRVAILALALALTACNPAQAPSEQTEAPATTAGDGQTQAPDPERDAMAAALAGPAGEAIGTPVSFTVTTKTVDGDWGWLVTQPWTQDGTAIDWSTTRYAARAQEGVLDGGGTTYALLRRENGNWRVVDFAVGPTDVAYADWPRRYGAPPALMGLPPG